MDPMQPTVIEVLADLRKQVEIARLVEQFGIAAVQAQVSGQFFLNAQRASVIVDVPAASATVNDIARSIDARIQVRQVSERGVCAKKGDLDPVFSTTRNEHRTVYCNAPQ